MSNAKYLKIVKWLKKQTIKAEIEFIVSSAATFTAFTGVFQRQEPLIHVVHFELRRLCTVLLGQIVPADDVNLRILGGFEGLDSTADVYLQQPLCNERVLAALDSSKVILKDRTFFS